MEDITPTGWGDQFEDCKSFTSSITEQYQSPPSPKEVWDTLGELSGKYDFMVKYSAPLSSQIAIEDITPTGWDEHFKDNMTLTLDPVDNDFAIASHDFENPIYQTED